MVFRLYPVLANNFFSFLGLHSEIYYYRERMKGGKKSRFFPAVNCSAGAVNKDARHPPDTRLILESITAEGRC